MVEFVVVNVEFVVVILVEFVRLSVELVRFTFVEFVRVVDVELVEVEFTNCANAICVWNGSINAKIPLDNTNQIITPLESDFFIKGRPSC